MSEALIALLERMRVSRAALAAQLDAVARNQPGGKSNRHATAQRLGLAAAMAALTVVWRWRRRR